MSAGVRGSGASIAVVRGGLVRERTVIYRGYHVQAATGATACPRSAKFKTGDGALSAEVGPKTFKSMVHLLCQLAYIRSLLVPYSGVFLLEVLEDGGFAARLQVVQHVVSRK